MYPVDPNTSAGMLQENILYTFTAFEKRNIRLKFMNGKRTRYQEGYWVFNGVPNGYQKHKEGKNTILTLLEPKATYIKEALEMYASGILATHSDVYRYLKDKKITSNSKRNKTGRIHPTMVNNLFKPDTIYFYAGYFYKPRRGVKKPFRAKHPPIISMDTVQKIFERIDASPIIGKHHTQSNPDFPLKDFMHCGHCERKLTGYWSKGRNAKYPYYGCANKKDPHRFQVPRKKLTEEFQEFLEKITVPEPVREVFSVILQTYREQREQIQADWIKDKEKQINELDFRMGKIQQILVNSSSYHLIEKLEKEWEELNQQKIKVQKEIAHK
ncbi:MAG TPA: hypothetical protein DCS93_00795 [Microscillaceae bacterium]|nr:hypothetical protein [Microscillaceae bacterium]